MLLAQNNHTSGKKKIFIIYSLYHACLETESSILHLRNHSILYFVGC